MILTELFNSPIEPITKKQSKFAYRTVTPVGNLTVTFNAVIGHYGDTMGWWISFDTEESGDSSGDFAAPVFGVVKKSLESFIKAYRPKTIIFTAEEHLSQVYKRMLDRYLKQLPNYMLEVKQADHDYTGAEFILTRK